jgi:LysM repeat protein
MKFGHSYCVEVNNGNPRPGESSSTTTSAVQASPTKNSKPSPTQDKLIDTCTNFYQAKKGDTCPKIIAEYKDTFNSADLLKWNPAIGDDCSGIWANYWYCVGVPGTPTAAPTRTAESTAKPTGDKKPSPTQEGLIDSCTSFHMATKDETCKSIISTFGTFDFATFFKWNPAIVDDCSGIWANYWYCVAVPGTPTANPSITSTKPAGTGIPTPSPIQEGMVKNCIKFHPVSKTTTCDSIEKYYKLSFAQFFAWNPAVGEDCSGLWANYNVCVSVRGYKPSTTMIITKPTTTKPTNGISTPSPIQDNMVKSCEKFHQIKSTTTCTSIETYYNLPLSTFLLWNPAVGKDCTHLLTGYWVCIATIGWNPPTKTITKASTTAKSPNGISTPPPIQTGMVGNCKRFHMVKSTTTCDSIQKYYKITMAQLVKWNPVIGSKCTGLWANYNVCVGV